MATLSKSSFPVVGVRLPSWATFTRRLFSGILEYMRAHDQWQIQTVMDSTNEMKPVIIDAAWKGDGLILFRLTPMELKSFRRKRIPMINISTECQGMGIPTVIPDNRQIGALAAEHLLSIGLTKFAYFGDPTRRYSNARAQAFEETLNKAGHECIRVELEPDRFPWSRRWDHIHACFMTELRRLPLPIGIFGKDDIFAANIINICFELNLKVPDDVAVVGINSDEIFCHTTAPPLTSVRYPGETIGYRAAEVLDQLMKGKRGRVPDLIEAPVTEIHVRESTNVLAFKDELVAKAVRQIRQTAPEYPLRVDELIQKAPLSPAAFKNRFNKALGCSPKAEINRVRIQHLQRLLRQTNLPIGQIALQMRFESSEELGRFFRRHMGTTPTRYRREFMKMKTGIESSHDVAVHG